MRRFRKHHYGTVQMASSPSLHACCAGGQETSAQGLHRAAHGEQTRIWFCRFSWLRSTEEACGRPVVSCQPIRLEEPLGPYSADYSTVVCVDAAFVSVLSTFGRQWSTVYLCASVQIVNVPPAPAARPCPV